MNCKSEIDLGPMKGADLLGEYNLSHVLRTLHIATGQKHYKVRYCVRRRNAKKHTMLTVISIVNGTTFREAVVLIYASLSRPRLIEKSIDHRELFNNLTFIDKII